MYIDKDKNPSKKKKRKRDFFFRVKNRKTRILLTLHVYFVDL